MTVSKLNVQRLTAIAFTVVLTAFPTEIRRDRLLDASEPEDWVDAVAYVRFQAHRPSSIDGRDLTRHTATVLGIFKNHPLLPLPAEPVVVIERRGFMYSEDGYWPCWDNEQPIPVATEAMVFLRWHAEQNVFWLGSVGGTGLRMAKSSRDC